MTEKAKSLSPEAQQMLPEAAQTVLNHYAGDKLTIGLEGIQSLGQRENLWSRAAQKFPPFSETIAKLRETLKIAYIHSNFTELTIASINFDIVEDDYARELLGELLIARLIKPDGFMDPTGINDEVREMLTSLVTDDAAGWEKIKSLKPLDVFTSILSGNLRLTPLYK